MGKTRRLQCKSLHTREKNRWRKNNGYQWKNNAKNNGNNEKYRGETTSGCSAGRRAMNAARASLPDEPSLFVGFVDESGRGRTKSRPSRRLACLKPKRARSGGAAGARMSLCTYCHAPLARGMQARFHLSPLFRGAPGCRQ